ncbi:MAG: glycine cleavage system aminomethyltransferase GcvT, partial [Gammaproteobacteria bacterium]|nr:glycine cleavage system aminomethyltransferase GcvT [Gammaproteobacteria bacterium]
FDVSHMGQIELRGDNTAELLETLVPGDISGLAPWRQRYTVLTNENGGIIDDLLVTRVPGGLFLVVNGARREQDLQHLRHCLRGRSEVIALDERALLALQGPESAAVLGELTPEINELRFLGAGEFKIEGTPCLISRSGYTGEDGFEISVAAEHAEAIARRLLKHSAVEPAGLGARDSLRLEAGLCLYGHDLDETTSPVEAGLAWTIARRYRSGAGSPRFPGARRILKELAEGPLRLRVGLKPEGPVPVREGAVLTRAGGEKIGRVTSGGYGITLDAPIAMGYVQAACAAPGTELSVDIRDHSHTIRVAELPFVKPRYQR